MRVPRCSFCPESHRTSLGESMRAGDRAMPWGTARGGGPGRASLPELQRGGRDRRLEQPGRRTGRNGDATSLPARGGAVDLDSGVDDRRGPCGHLGADGSGDAVGSFEDAPGLLGGGPVLPARARLPRCRRGTPRLVPTPSRVRPRTVPEVVRTVGWSLMSDVHRGVPAEAFVAVSGKVTPVSSSDAVHRRRASAPSRAALDRLTSFGAPRPCKKPAGPA